MALNARRYGQAEWLAGLADLILDLAVRWDLELEEPFSGKPSISWVAPAGIDSDGTPLVLKVGLPHREGRTEAAGLRSFAGTGAVRLIRSDEEAFALLEERCLPGQDLWSLDVEQGNKVAATVLSQLWRPAEDAHQIESLSDLAQEWVTNFAHQTELYSSELVDLAGRLAVELAESQPENVVLHGDFNPGNVLASQRGWLSIDCKPLVGEPAFDLAQLLANRLGAFDSGHTGPKDPAFRPHATSEEIDAQVGFFTTSLGLSRERIIGWAIVKALAWEWGPATAGFFADLL